MLSSTIISSSEVMKVGIRLEDLYIRMDECMCQKRIGVYEYFRYEKPTLFSLMQ